MVLFNGTANFTLDTELTTFGGLLHAGGATFPLTTTFSPTIGDVIQPQVVSAVPSSPTVVRVTFDNEMANDAQLSEPSNYLFTPAVGGAPVTAISVAPEAVAFPTYVDVTTSEHTDGINYTVEVSNVTDRFLNGIDPAADSDTYAGLGTKPQLASVDVRSSVPIRLNFDEEMTKNPELLDPTNYSVVPITPGAAPVFFTQVITPEGDNFPDWVELPVSEMTDGATYEVTVSDSGPVDRALNTMDPANNDLQFTGEGVPPDVAQVIAIGPNRVDVVYNEPMKDNADIRNPANYVWDNGLLTLDVLDFVDETTIQLVTSDQQEGTLYTLTVS